MLYRAALLSVTLFWLLMNVLLWRAEYGQRDAARTPVPVAVVWHKMLTAPDTSSLTILHHGKKFGFCHWMTSITGHQPTLAGVQPAPKLAPGGLGTAFGRLGADAPAEG